MTSPRISVLYVTKRYGGIDVLLSSLERQTLQDFELVLVDELYEVRHPTLLGHLQAHSYPFEVVHLPVRGYSDGRQTTLCRADNIGLAACRGELVVFLQDYIWIPANGLQQLYEDFQLTRGQVLITTLMDRYSMPDHPVRFPDCPLTVFDHWCTHAPEGERAWTDVRTPPAQLWGPINSIFWETSWAAIPRVLVERLGGVDEDYDWGRPGYDNQSLSCRAELLGYKTLIDGRLHGRGFDHYAFFDESPALGLPSSQARHEERIRNIVLGREPMVLHDYLAPWREMRDAYVQR